MTLAINRAALAAALATVADVVDARAPIPVLSNVILEAKGGALTITGTNLNMHVSIDVAVEAGKLERCCPSFATLRAAATSLIGDTVDVKLDAKAGTLKISAGRANRTVRTLPPEDFPLLPDNDEGVALAVPASDLRRVLDFARPAASVDTVRSYLNGVFAEPDGDGVNFVATDGNRLHRTRLAVAAPEGMASAILPSAFVAVLCKLSDEGTAELRLSAKRAHYSAGNARIVSKLVEGSFPEYRRVVPDAGEMGMEVGADEFARAALAAASVATEKVRAVRLDLDAGEAAFTCTAPDTGSAAVEPVRDVVWKGQDFAIGFNAALLAGSVRCFGDRQIVAAFDDATAPALFTAPTLPDAFVVIMPMRI